MKYTKSKTALFLMELIITILLFSVCSAVCVQLFVRSYTLSKQTKELNHAVIWAQGYAELLRGGDGSLEFISSHYPSAVVVDDTFFEVFYDSDFQPCEYADACYVSDITMNCENMIVNMDIRISDVKNHSEIYTLTASKFLPDGEKNER